MTESDQINHLSDDLDALVNRYRDEYDMTYASVVGVLQMKQWLLCDEAVREGDAEREKEDLP